VGYAMRGGKIYIKGNAGYRVGIHMKAFNQLSPVIIIGGRGGNFLGEYMAGGMIILLGLDRQKKSPVGTYVGTGMHAGKIYVRGYVRNYQLGKEIRLFDVNQDDWQEMLPFLEEYCRDFHLSLEDITKEPFVKLSPYSHRPYGKLYAY
jgi:glutamate synthase domain-containing protein 3